MLEITNHEIYVRGEIQHNHNILVRNNSRACKNIIEISRHCSTDVLESEVVVLNQGERERGFVMAGKALTHTQSSQQ